MSGIVGSKLNIRGSGRIAKLGADGQVLTSAGAGKPANYEDGSTSYDDDAVRDDIATLALHQATNANAAKYNLVNTNVDQYEDSSGVASFTDCERNVEGEYVASAIAGSGVDANTVFMLHCNDAGLTDSSANAFAITLGSGGGVSRSATQSKFGGFSAFCDGSANSYYQVPDLDGEVGTGDWTLDFWFWTPNNDELRPFSMGNGVDPGSTGGTLVFSGGASLTNSRLNGTGFFGTWYPVFDSAFSTSTWVHRAFQRTGTTMYGWGDGVPFTSTTTSLSGTDMETYGTNNQADVAFFARGGSTTEIFDGYVDECRYSNVSRYTGGVAFTPPTEAYSASIDNATGNYVSTATTANASVTTMGAVITYKNNVGTNTLNTDIIVEVSANGGTNYTTAVLTAGGTFSTGILQAVANDISVTAGTSIIYRISFANQEVGVKEARIYGASLMY